MRAWLTFYECEHQGDLAHYETDLERAGAIVVESSVEEDSEVGRVLVEFDDRAVFVAAFRETPAADFCSQMGGL